MGLKIVENIGDANFITHSGSFHTDEVFCTVFFEMLSGDVNLYRTRELNGAREDSIVFDVGKGELDHHQNGGNGKRDNGIKYAAFGLVWKKYGRDLLSKVGVQNIDEVIEEFDKSFICGLDAHDNGQIDNKNVGLLSFNAAIESLNPVYGTSQTEEEQYLKAVNISRDIFINQLELSILKCKSKLIIDKAINDSSDGIMYLGYRFPYEELLINSENPKAKELLYVIRPGKTEKDGYSINTIPLVFGSFDHRQFFPLEWGGKSPEELKNISGIKTLKFCHQNRFLCITDTLEDAYKVARDSIKLQINQEIKR